MLQLTHSNLQAYRILGAYSLPQFIEAEKHALRVGATLAQFTSHFETHQFLVVDKKPTHTNEVHHG
jgi:hypothetical protein